VTSSDKSERWRGSPPPSIRAPGRGLAALAALRISSSWRSSAAGSCRHGRAAALRTSDSRRSMAGPRRPGSVADGAVIFPPQARTRSPDDTAWKRLSSYSVRIVNTCGRWGTGSMKGAADEHRLLPQGNAFVGSYAFGLERSARPALCDRRAGTTSEQAAPPHSSPRLAGGEASVQNCAYVALSLIGGVALCYPRSRIQAKQGP
jgi:hypothetical protein